jgi:glutaminase
MKIAKPNLKQSIMGGLIALLLISIGFFSFTRNKEKAKEENIKAALKEAYDKFKTLKGGKNADYIPYLAKVDSTFYGIVIVTADGKVYPIGETKYEFGIESISKVFTLAQALQEKGGKVIMDSIGANATGLPFNSVQAIEIEGQQPQNPFVNAGAIATVSLLDPKNSQEAKWAKVQKNFNRFAGRELKVIEELYKSESATDQHNEAIALLLKSYNKLYDSPEIALDVYTKQCSFGVNAKDLAVMAATLANNGINPLTKEKVVDSKHIPQILAVMSTAGLYETTGEWMFKVGLPSKSGVGGGIISVVPGQMGIAVFAPPLDKAGNSVKAQKTIEFLSDRLNLNLFAARK